MDRTRLLKRATLVFLPISVAFQILCSLLKDVPAIAILFLMSAMLPLFLLTLAPRYVKLSTSSALCVQLQQFPFLGIQFHPHFC